MSSILAGGAKKRPALAGRFSVYSVNKELIMIESLGIIVVLTFAIGYGLYALIKKAVKDAYREMDEHKKS